MRGGRECGIGNVESEGMGRSVMEKWETGGMGREGEVWKVEGGRRNAEGGKKDEHPPAMHSAFG